MNPRVVFSDVELRQDEQPSVCRCQGKCRRCRSAQEAAEREEAFQAALRRAQDLGLDDDTAFVVVSRHFGYPQGTAPMVDGRDFGPDFRFSAGSPAGRSRTGSIAFARRR